MRKSAIAFEQTMFITHKLLSRFLALHESYDSMKMLCLIALNVSKLELFLLHRNWLIILIIFFLSSNIYPLLNLVGMSMRI